MNETSQIHLRLHALTPAQKLPGPVERPGREGPLGENAGGGESKVGEGKGERMNPATWTTFDRFYSRPVQTRRAHYITNGKTLCGKAVPAHASLEYVEGFSRDMCKGCRKAHDKGHP